MVRGTLRAYSPHYGWVSRGGGSRELELRPGKPVGTQDSSEFRRAGGSLRVREAGPGRAGGAGRRRRASARGCRGRAVLGAGGQLGCGFHASRAGFACVCDGPRLPAPSTLQVRAGRVRGRAAGAPRRGHLLTAGSWPRRAAFRSGDRWPARPRRAPCFEVRTPPSPAPRSSPFFAPSPAAHPWVPPPPRLPEGRSHERDVQLSSHRRHRLLVRRGLRQWLHQHFGVSEPSSRGAQAARGLGGPWC